MTSGLRPALPDGIAEQHDLLSTLVAGLREAHDLGAPWHELASKIDGVIAHVGAHFESEEAAMGRGGYPKLDEHRQHHRTFMRRLQVLRAECDRRETELMPVFTELLETWLKHHEGTEDKLALEFLGV